MIQGLNLKRSPGGHLMWQLLTFQMLNCEKVQKVPNEKLNTGRGIPGGIQYSNHFLTSSEVLFFKCSDVQYVRAVAYQRNIGLVRGRAGEVWRCFSFLPCQAMNCTPVPVPIKPCLLFSERGRKTSGSMQGIFCLPQLFSCFKANISGKSPLFFQHCLLSSIYMVLSIMRYLAALFQNG